MKRLLLLPALLLLACGDAAPPPPAGGPIVSGDDGPPVIRLTFLTPGEKPIPGVRVLARMPLAAGPEGLEGITAVSDDEGVARLDVEGRLDPAADAPVHLTAEAPGYVTRRWQIPGFRPGRGMRVLVRLEPAGRIEGRVVASSGDPVADAFVFQIRRGLAGFLREDEVIATRTAEDGSYLLEGVPGGLQNVGVRAEAFQPAAQAEVTVTPGRTTTLPPFVLSPGLSISGRVSTPTGKPVPGARVRAWRHEPFADLRFFGPDALDRAGGATETDEEGRFRISGLAPDEYTVDAARLGWSIVDARRAGVPAGADDVRLTLERGFPLTIEVFDAKAKEPVADYRLVISELEAGADLQGRPIMVDDKQIHSPTGRIVVSLREGSKYRLEVAAEGYEIMVRGIDPIDEKTPGLLSIPLVPRK